MFSRFWLPTGGGWNETLDADTQQRVLNELDDVVNDEVGDPPAFATLSTG